MTRIDTRGWQTVTNDRGQTYGVHETYLRLRRTLVQIWFSPRCWRLGIGYGGRLKLGPFQILWYPPEPPEGVL